MALADGPELDEQIGVGRTDAATARDNSGRFKNYCRWNAIDLGFHTLKSFDERDEKAGKRISKRLCRFWLIYKTF